ncbi:hypothetical protein M1771_10090 [Spiroplasma citri]|uniref:Uncharacterized protein n=1 Tax=Spiroplasma citri TaxID=2133 RepID=A0AAX3SZ36_SPICI|nr:hypothetical protein [Spiroplasma citri]WFG96408.1 hypothetical protein M0C40_10120 [Spiroplasma citri]WFH00303.1 hypothetical protein M1771_10090 [Spiroplasma citri]
MNYRSKTTPSDIAQKEVFGYKISEEPTGNAPNAPINEPIPSSLSKTGLSIYEFSFRWYF